jgi:FlgD Ig-like domain/Cep192 domain 4
MKPIGIAVAVTLLSAGNAFSQIAQGPANGSIPGGVIVNTDNFFAESPEGYPGPVFKDEEAEKQPVPSLPDPVNLPKPAGAAGSNYFQDPSIDHLVDAPPPITIGDFAGMGQGVAAGFPPDPYLAVGPDHLIQVINTSFRICTKTGETIKTISFQSWFATTISNVSYSDPKVHYDHFAGRWIMTILTYNTTMQVAYDMISVSDDSDPIGVWYNWAIPSHLNGTTNSGTFGDYPGLGFDNQALYITSNHFTFPGAYQFAKIRIIGKAQLYANTAGPVTWTDFWNVTDLTGNDVIGIRPCVIHGSPNEYYLVATPRFVTRTYFTLYRLTSPLSAPSLTAVSVACAAWTAAPNANQLGGSSLLIDGGGSNGGLRNEPIYQDSSVWVIRSVASGSGNQYSSVAYVRINTLTNTASEDVAFGADGFWYTWPALQVDRDKNIAITFSRSGLTEYMGAGMTWRLDADPLGLRPTILFRPGNGNYVVNAGGRNRWGDYMGLGLDPSDRNNFWMLTEYAEATNTFGDWVHGVRLVPFPGARVSTSTSLINFGNVEAAHTSDTVSVTITNIGDNTLTVSSIFQDQSTYSLLNLPSLPANVPTFDSLTFGVVFHPTAHGTINDTIRISSNDATNPSAKIALVGRGIVIGRAQPGVMYASSSIVGTTPSQFYTIDPSSGSATLLGPTGVTEIDGLAIHPATRELYGVFANASGSSLYRMSEQHGDALFTRNIGIPNLRAITFSLAGDTLFGGTTNGRLYRIDLSTGDTTYIGTATGKIYSGFAINPTSGVLWASVRPPLVGRDSIFKVERSTGLATAVGRTGLGVMTPYIAFDKPGNLFAIIGSGTQTSTLYSLDTLAAAATIIGSTGTTGLTAIAMRTDSAAVVSVGERKNSAIPETFELGQNYPNPFNPTTTIQYGLPVQSHVTITIFNTVGQQVARLFSGHQSAGYHEIVWNTNGVDGISAASGIYFYKMEAEGDGKTFSQMKKMVLLK